MPLSQAHFALKDAAQSSLRIDVLGCSNAMINALLLVTLNFVRFLVLFNYKYTKRLSLKYSE